MICRWNHPVVPEKFLGCCKKRNNIYIHKSNKSDLIRCSLEKNILIGSSTCLGSNVRIRNSVIGSNCKIGNSVKLDGVYIWNNVEVGDNCTISSTIIAEGAKINDGVVLRKGCLISSLVIIGSKVSLSQNSIANCNDKQTDRKLIGADGRGILHHRVSDEEKKPFLTCWEPDEEVVGVGDSTDEEDDESDDSDLETANEEDDVKVFFKELIDNFVRGVDEKISCDNLILEVNSIK